MIRLHMESHDQTQRPSVRKGAWMREEDDLLRKCIQKYGEGHWNQVPLIAGLNRCRKSCRLRWLNYLKPDIKRGEFAMDEVDLLIRMHKLIGNKWSLIAGRIPGRTANDVKNYWNTHLKKKQPENVDMININSTTASTRNDKRKVPVIRPQAQSFSENSKWIKKRTMHRSDHEQPSSSSRVVINTDGHEPLPEFLTDEALISWWQENIDLLISQDDHERMMKKKGVVLQTASEEAEKVINSGYKSTNTDQSWTTTSKDKEQDHLSVDDYLLDQQKFHGDKRNTNNVVGDEEGLQSDDDFDRAINLFFSNGHKF